MYKATNNQYYLNYLAKNGDALGGTGWAMTEFGWDVKYAGVQTLVAKVITHTNSLVFILELVFDTFYRHTTCIINVAKIFSCRYLWVGKLETMHQFSESIKKRQSFSCARALERAVAMFRKLQEALFSDKDGTICSLLLVPLSFLLSTPTI